jgi:hypothetical protein
VREVGGVQPVRRGEAQRAQRRRREDFFAAEGGKVGFWSENGVFGVFTPRVLPSCSPPCPPCAPPTAIPVLPPLLGEVGEKRG